MARPDRGLLRESWPQADSPQTLRLEHLLHFADLFVAKENQDLELEETWEAVSRAVTGPWTSSRRCGSPRVRPWRPTWP